MIMILSREYLSLARRPENEINTQRTSSIRKSSPCSIYNLKDKKNNAYTRETIGQRSSEGIRKNHYNRKCHLQPQSFTSRSFVNYCHLMATITLLLSTILILTTSTDALVIAAERGDSQTSDEEANRNHYSYQLHQYQHQQHHHHQQRHHRHYQPSLIGFRCEITRDITSNGVSVIEANSPVTLTLYGESFSTNTIIAFTNEFQPQSYGNYNDNDGDNNNNDDDNWLDLSNLPLRLDNGDRRQLPNESKVNDSTTVAAAAAAKTNETIELGQAPTGRPLVSNDMSQVERAPKRKFVERRKFQSTSYDCTDYNRVTSYRLTRENILSPNVVTLTVTLPELDPGAGMYYYFCIKQPKLTPDSGANNNNNTDRSRLPSTLSSSDGELVWVHQGIQWWVTLKVEPPILSITNDIVLIVFLLFLSAVTSGLNLGLMSLDMNELAVISSCGDHKERSYARTIAPLRKRGNYLLCSLLLGNVMVNSTLTVILEELTSGVIAIIGSTLAIVVLGEIVPQAFCARQGLAIGAKTIYLTYAFMILTFPLSWPISCLLDWVLGEEKGNVYDRERLMEFIRITGHHTQLEADEVAIISGALKLKKIKVDQIMTRIEDVFMLPIDCKLDRDTIKRIIEKGYSRIPVFEFGDRKQIVALILAKDLALIDPDDHTPIASMLMYCKHPLIFIENDTPLDVALNEFKTGKSHMAVVRQIYDDGEIDKYYEAIGVVTLEDVIEEVLQVEINDETDTLSDNRRKRRRTDAQVAHLIDELTQTTSSSAAGTTNTTANPIGNKVFNPSSAGGVVVAAGKDNNNHQLTSQFTEISISGLTRSLGGGGINSSSSISGYNQESRNSNCATPIHLQSSLTSSPHELSYSPSLMSQYHSIELSSTTPAAAASPNSRSNSAIGLVQASPVGNPQHQHQHQHKEQEQHQPQEQQNGDTQEAAGSLISRATQFISQMMS